MRHRMLLVVAGAVAVVLALSALFISDFSEVKQERERGIFLPDTADLISRTEVEDTAHFLGEEFRLTFVIQYRHNALEPDIDSLDSAVFLPFEIAERVDVSHEKLTEDISQYVYEVRLVAIEAFPGREYSMEEILLRHKDLSTGDSGETDISPAFNFQIGTYYGGNTEEVKLRPPKEALKYGFILRKKLFGGAALIVLAALVFAVSLRRRSLKRDPAAEEAVSEREMLILALESFGVDEWLRSEPARVRLLQLEKLAVELADLLLEVEPKSFWISDNHTVEGFCDLLGSAYQKPEPEYEDVARTATVILETFNNVLTDNERGR